MMNKFVAADDFLIVTDDNVATIPLTISDNKCRHKKSYFQWRDTVHI